MPREPEGAEQSSELRPVLCVRHQPTAPLGVGEKVFEEEKVRYTYLDVWSTEDIPPLAEFSGLVVLGGEMHAHKVDEYPFLKRVLDLVKKALDEEVPTFGICLGAQLLAAARGAEVRPSEVREIGFHRLMPTTPDKTDTVLSEYDSGARVFQFHEDTFDLPEEAELLFSTESVAHQAFRIGWHAYGVQFHPEVTRAEIKAWADLAGTDEALKQEWGVTAAELLQQADEFLEESQRTGRAAFRGFLRLCREGRPA